MTSGILPKDWKDIELGDALKRIKRPVELDPSMMYREIGIRSHGKGIFHKEERTGESIGEKSVFWVEPDCFVVNIVFAWEQAIAKTTANEKGMIASHRFPMYKPARDMLDLDYLVYFFQSPRGKYLLGLASPGGAGRNKTLGQQEFLNLTIPLPPYNEQRKIVDMLSTWDQSIALNENLIAQKKTFKKGLMQQLLTRKRRYPEFKNSKWNQLTLGEQGVFIRGVAYNPSTDLYNNDTHDSIRLLRSNNIKGERINLDEVQYVREAKVNKQQKIKLNDIVICMANGSKDLVGKTAVFSINDDQQYTVGAFCAIFRVNEKIDRDFAGYLFQSEEYKKKLYSISAGSNINNLRSSELAKFVFSVPPTSEEQKAISNVLNICDREIDILTSRLKTLKQQKKGLMQKLLTGQIRVKV